MWPVWVGFYCTALLYQTGTSIFSLLSKHLSGRPEEDRSIMEIVLQTEASVRAVGGGSSHEARSVRLTFERHSRALLTFFCPPVSQSRPSPVKVQQEPDPQ